MKKFYLRRVLAVAAGVLALAPTLGLAAPFTPGNIVVARVGDGSAALSASASAVFLDEYTPTGQLVQTISLPTSVSGGNRILTASGNATTELSLTRSADGHYLTLAGYGAAPGTANVSSSAAADVARVIGLVGADGTVNTSTSAGDAFSGVSVRGAATADGSSFYSVGANSGVRYQALGTASSTQLNTAPTNLRAVGVADGNLYVASASSPYIGLSQVGTGLPTATGQTATALPGFPGSTSGSSPYSFYFADLSAAVPGVDVAYVADDRSSSGGIQKWSLAGGTWTLNGTIAGSATFTLRGLSGSTSGTSVSLVAISSNAVFVLSDATGYNVAPTATLPTPLATPGTNTLFRGVAFAPVAAAPTVASFAPASGPAGTLVTVTGTNFSGATGLTLNGAAVSGYTVVNATTLTFTVPAGASSGPIAVTTAAGSATSATSFSLVLGVAASQALPGLQVFPNPATDHLTLKLPQAGPATVALRDLTGRVVLPAAALPATQQLHLPATLAAGVYVLEVQQNGVTAVRRVVKK